MHKKLITYSVTALLTAFALITLFLSTSVIFNLFDIRAREGHYVPFVVWANWASSLLYLAASVGLATQKKWASLPLWAAAIILALAFIGLLIHAATGGLYETKTIAAMACRICLTLALAWASHYKIAPSKV
jgi:hypothetical protein